jgi:uncharacterized protein (DUF433 family)
VVFPLAVNFLQIAPFVVFPLAVEFSNDVWYTLLRGIEPMNELKSYITFNNRIRFGKPCITGTRITVGDILGWLAAGMTNSEILEDYPELQTIHIRAALAFAAERDAMTKVIHVSSTEERNDEGSPLEAIAWDSQPSPTGAKVPLLTLIFRAALVQHWQNSLGNVHMSTR